MGITIAGIKRCRVFYAWCSAQFSRLNPADSIQFSASVVLRMSVISM